MNKNATISARIIAAMATGMTVREAIDHVLGAGTSATLVDELYKALRAS